MSSSEGGSGSDEQPDESVEYSGAPVDGMVFFILGVVAIVVIVVVVLLVVFLLNRKTAEDTEPAKGTKEPGNVCGNPCNGVGRVCRPESQKDVHGCFVQDCHCYSPNETQPCSNPCNMTGQVCNFKTSPLDHDGCYINSKCHCVTCPNHCGVDEKCDANSPYGPDGCPMPNCICVPTKCPARCPIGEQCPDVGRDGNGCLPQDCNCVPISGMTTRRTTDDYGESTPSYLCPVVCPEGRSCHPQSKIDVYGCFELGCKCVRDTCPNKCASGEVCPYDTPLTADGCLVDTCSCVPIHGASSRIPPPALPDVSTDGAESSNAPPALPGVSTNGTESSIAPPASPQGSARFAPVDTLNDSTSDGILPDETGALAPNATQPEAARVPRQQPDSDQDNSTGSPPIEENSPGGPGGDNESSILAEHTSGLGAADATSVGPDARVGGENHTEESYTGAEATDGGLAGQSKADEGISKDNESSSVIVTDIAPPSSHGDAEQLGSEHSEGKAEASPTDAEAAGDDHNITQAETEASAAESSTVGSIEDAAKSQGTEARETAADAETSAVGRIEDAAKSQGTEASQTAADAETSTVGSIGDAAKSQGDEANETVTDAGDAAAAIDAASGSSSKVRRSVRGSDQDGLGTGEGNATFDAFGMAKKLVKHFRADTPQEGINTGKKTPQVLPVIGDPLSSILALHRGAGDAGVLNATSPRRV